MEKYDTALEARVWERLRREDPAPPEPPRDGETLLTMIRERWADALTYRQLVGRISGPAGTVLKKLWEEEQSHVACLKGIYTMVTGEKADLTSLPASGESVGVILRRCYGRQIRCLQAYEARRAHPEYGPVFFRLAEQKRNHCMILLQLLGSLEEKGRK